MKDEEILAFAESHLERIEGPHGGSAYRCAATLADGVKLPCVLIASAQRVVELALRRFAETRSDAELPEAQRRFGHGGRYADVVRSFVTSGDRINGYDIASLDLSPFAIPLARLREVHGETSMSWTQFAAVMRDGREFGFGTTFLMEFFHMPEGYSGQDIVSIVSHKRVDPIFRERPYFTCYIDGI